MSTLRISNIEAKADNSSPTVDEQLKITNSTGDLMLYLDGRTSGITTVGINTTNQTIKFDENNNVFITGIVTATELHGTVAVGTSVTYGDNEKAYFGTGLDLQIFHDASGGHSRIDDTGTGGLVLRGSNILLEKYGGGYLANFKPDDSVDLFYAGNKKFETTNTGAVVTGICTATTFSGAVSGTTGTFTGEVTIPTWLVHTGDPNTKFGFEGPDTITFETGGSERLRIESNGKIAIGNHTGASHDIHIKHASSPGIRLEDTTNTVKLTMFAQDANSGIANFSNHPLLFYTNSINRIQLTNDGKVQIGLPGNSASLPGAVDSVSIRARDEGNLHIRDIGNLTSPPSGSGVGIDVLNNASNTVKDLCVRGANVILRNASAETLRITSAGEVLIGRTAKPNDINKLVVTGTSPADAYDSQLYLEGSETSGAVDTGGALAFGGHDGGTARNWANIYGMKENANSSNYAAYMSFHTRPAGGGPTERLRITSSGNVTTCGTSTFDRSTVGVTARAGDSLNVTRSNGTPLEICRTTSDGNMINFFRGSNGVGQIGWNGSSLQFGTWSDTDVLKVGSTVDITKKLNVNFPVSGNDYVAYFKNQNANSYGVAIVEPSSVNNGYPLLSCSDSSGNSHFRVDSGGVVYANSGGGTNVKAYFIRAWINFDMTNSAIRDSGNVASVTDHGVGDFAISFSTNIVDNDYAIGGTATNWEGTNSDSYCHIGVFRSGLTASSFRIKCIRSRFDQQPPHFKDSNEVMLTVTR